MGGRDRKEKADGTRASMKFTMAFDAGITYQDISLLINNLINLVRYMH